MPALALDETQCFRNVTEGQTLSLRKHARGPGYKPNREGQASCRAVLLLLFLFAIFHCKPDNKTHGGHRLLLTLLFRCRSHCLISSLWIYQCFRTAQEADSYKRSSLNHAK